MYFRTDVDFDVRLGFKLNCVVLGIVIYFRRVLNVY